MAFKNNLFLDALAGVEGQALAPHLARIELKQHQTLFDVRENIPKIYFAIDAVVSLVVPLASGEVVETAMVGRDGVIGAGAVLNGRVSLNRGVVQIGGVPDLRNRAIQERIDKVCSTSTTCWRPRANIIRTSATISSLQRDARSRKPFGALVAKGSGFTWRH